MKTCLILLQEAVPFWFILDANRSLVSEEVPRVLCSLSSQTRSFLAAERHVQVSYEPTIAPHGANLKMKSYSMVILLIFRRRLFEKLNVVGLKLVAGWQIFNNRHAKAHVYEVGEGVFSSPRNRFIKSPVPIINKCCFSAKKNCWSKRFFRINLKNTQNDTIWCRGL